MRSAFRTFSLEALARRHCTPLSQASRKSSAVLFGAAGERRQERVVGTAHSLGADDLRSCLPSLSMEDDMFRIGEQTNETTTEARASVNVKGMTTVLGGGLVLVILAFSLILLLT